jgi:GNAT superfamily N-acetyltransferase
MLRSLPGLVRAALRYARGRGVRAALAKALCMYVAGPQRWYVIREDLSHPVAPGPEAAALDVRLAGPDDLDWLAALGHHDRATVGEWLAPGYFLFVAFRDGAPVGFRCVSRHAAPWVADWFRRRPDQLYGVDIYVVPEHRRGGMARAIFARTSPLLHARGFTELLACSASTTPTRSRRWRAAGSPGSGG